MKIHFPSHCAETKDCKRGAPNKISAYVFRCFHDEKRLPGRARKGQHASQSQRDAAVALMRRLPALLKQGFFRGVSIRSTSACQCFWLDSQLAMSSKTSGATLPGLWYSAGEPLPSPLMNKSFNAG